jgi:hypothetical protein
MMEAKKLFLMFAAVGMMLTTSCTNDDAFDSSNNKALVTFSLDLEDAMSTRAISDGSGINKLIYAVFDGEGNRVMESDASAEFPFEETFSFIKGEEYTAVFWAQNKDCSAYTISEDYTTINVDYTAALNNDESRDAFFQSTTFTVVDELNIKVVLKRPFAQVNLGVTQDDWQNAKNVGLEISRSSVEIKQAASGVSGTDSSIGLKQRHCTTSLHSNFTCQTAYNTVRNCSSKLTERVTNSYYCLSKQQIFTSAYYS